MKIDFSAPIRNFEGDAIENLTLGTASIQSLMTPVKGDEDMPVLDKVRYFKLASALHGAAEIDLPIEDVALIKERVGKVFTVLVVGRVFELLER